MRLKDRVAIVTGGGRGIGRAIAERFAAEGAAVLLVARTRSQLQETVRAIERTGGRAAFEVGDVSQEATADRVVEAAAKRFEPVDILVNNAGIYGPIDDLTIVAPAEWDRVLAINLRGAYLMMRAVVPGMVERRRGAILNMASVSGKQAYAWSGPYAASKAGLIALTRVVAAEVGRAGVRVNALCPGTVRNTAMWDEVGAGLRRKMGVSEEVLDRETRAEILQGRPLEPEEVAAAALFLCSDEASAITGQAVNVDGGTVFY